MSSRSYRAVIPSFLQPPSVQDRSSAEMSRSSREQQAKKPLSIAVQELYEGKVKILGDNDAEEAEEAKAIEAAADGDPEAFGIEAEPG